MIWFVTVQVPVLPSSVSCQKGERAVFEVEKKSDILQNSNEVTIQVYMALQK